MHVLVVDDDAAIRSLWQVMLGMSMDLTLAADGVEARARLAETSFDAVLLDVMLPDESGFDLLEMLRADPATTDVPVIMVTARSTESDHAAAYAGGADGYLTKPFDVDEVLDLLGHVAALTPGLRAAARTQQLRRAQLLSGLESAFDF